MPRCVDCGYLAALGLQSRDLCEVEAGMRDRWEIPGGLHRGFNKYDDFPVCYAEAANLAEQIGQYSPKRVLEVINAVQNCKEFCEHQLGSSPKDHREMLTAREALANAANEQERNRIWQAAESERMRRWQEDRDQKQWDQQERLAGKEHSRKVFLLIIGAIVGAVFGLLGFLGGKFFDRVFDDKPKSQPISPAQPQSIPPASP